MPFDLKKKLKAGFTKAVETYTAVDNAVERQRDKLINAVEDKLAGAARKRREAANEAAKDANKDAPKP